MREDLSHSAWLVRRSEFRQMWVCLFIGTVRRQGQTKMRHGSSMLTEYDWRSHNLPLRYTMPHRSAILLVGLIQHLCNPLSWWHIRRQLHNEMLSNMLSCCRLLGLQPHDPRSYLCFILSRNILPPPAQPHMSHSLSRSRLLPRYYDHEMREDLSRSLLCWDNWADLCRQLFCQRKIWPQQCMLYRMHRRIQRWPHDLPLRQAVSLHILFGT